MLYKDLIKELEKFDKTTEFDSDYKFKKNIFHYNVFNDNIQLERGTYGTQDYKYHIIEFEPEEFEENLFEFFEKTINWYIKNNGICE